MKLNRKQQVYTAILGVGLGSLLLDKTLLSPQVADGNASPAPHVVVEGSAPSQEKHEGSAGRQSGTPSQTYLTVGMRLERFVEEGRVDHLRMRDAFLPSASWISDFETRGGADSPGSKAAEFISNYRLIGVYSSQGSRYAIIGRKKAAGRRGNGKKGNVILAVDEEIDGFRLISVDDHLAVLQNQELTVVLKLENKGLQEND